MKILVLASQFLPMQSGVSYVILKDITLLRDVYKHEITVLTLNYKNPKKYEEDYVNGFLVKRYSYMHLGQGYCFSLAFLRGLFKEKGFDIIHSHHYGYFLAFAGLIYAKLKGIPHIFTPYFHPPIYGFFRKLLFFLYHITQGLWIIRFSSFVLPTTEHEKQLLIKIWGKEKNMILIGNPINTDFFKPANVKPYTGLRKNIVLFVGTVVWNKGADIFMDIAEKILEKRNDTSFVFIGHGKWIKKPLMDRAKNFSKDCFLFLEYLSENELRDWYCRANVKVLPSYYESFGMVLAESLSCGTPVVTTNVGATPFVVDNNKSGYIIDYGRWGLMQDKIEFLLDNPKLAKKMGLYGRQQIIKKFNQNKVVKRLNNIYTLCNIKPFK